MKHLKLTNCGNLLWVIHKFLAINAKPLKPRLSAITMVWVWWVGIRIMQTAMMVKINNSSPDRENNSWLK